MSFLADEPVLCVILAVLTLNALAALQIARCWLLELYLYWNGSFEKKRQADEVLMKTAESSAKRIAKWLYTEGYFERAVLTRGLWVGRYEDDLRIKKIQRLIAEGLKDSIRREQMKKGA